MEQYFSLTASNTPGFLNAIYYPQYWLGLGLALWPVFKWTDGFTPGPDQFDNGTYYMHWGNLRWGLLQRRCRGAAEAPRLRGRRTRAHAWGPRRQPLLAPARACEHTVRRIMHACALYTALARATADGHLHGAA